MKKETPSKIDQEARRYCTHTIVFTNSVDKRAASLAVQGLTTKAIAKELGITPSEAQYRITKAQNSQGVRFRQQYRTGQGKLVQRMIRANERIANRYIERKVAPKFIPLARAGVGRMQ